jgi:uncharacterized protein (TIGR00369 family)
MNKEIDVERLWRGWSATPFHDFLHMELKSWDKTTGEVQFCVPFKTAYKRSATHPGIHGGVLASIIDVAADFALAIHADQTGLPTIDLKIDYLRSAGDEDLQVVARVLKSGRGIGVADVEIRDTRKRLCAIGRGNYAMVGWASRSGTK